MCANRSIGLRLELPYQSMDEAEGLPNFVFDRHSADHIRRYGMLVTYDEDIANW